MSDSAGFVFKKKIRKSLKPTWFIMACQFSWALQTLVGASRYSLVQSDLHRNEITRLDCYNNFIAESVEFGVIAVTQLFFNLF